VRLLVKGNLLYQDARYNDKKINMSCKVNKLLFSSYR